MDTVLHIPSKVFFVWNDIYEGKGCHSFCPEKYFNEIITNEASEEYTVLFTFYTKAEFISKFYEYEIGNTAYLNLLLEIFEPFFKFYDNYNSSKKINKKGRK